MTMRRKKANSIQALNNIRNVHFTVTGPLGKIRFGPLAKEAGVHTTLPALSCK